MLKCPIDRFHRTTKKLFDLYSKINSCLILSLDNLKYFKASHSTHRIIRDNQNLYKYKKLSPRSEKSQ